MWVQVEMQVEVGCWWSGLTADQGMHRPRSQPRGLEERSPRVRLAGQRVKDGRVEGALGSALASSQVNGHLSLIQVVWDRVL